MEALGQAAKEIPAGTAMGAYLQEIRASGACGSWANEPRVVLWAAFLAGWLTCLLPHRKPGYMPPSPRGSCPARAPAAAVHFTHAPPPPPPTRRPAGG